MSTSDDPSDSSRNIADEQSRLNEATPVALDLTAEQKWQAADDAQRQATKPPQPPQPTYKSNPERILGAIIFTTTVSALLYMILSGRLHELRNNLAIVVPLGGLAIIYSGTLLLPIHIADGMLGLNKNSGEKMLRLRRSYAFIIPKAGIDATILPLNRPHFKAMTPPGIYEARSSARIRVPKWIPAGAYLTVYNQGNPEPVNDQTPNGFTAQHVHNAVGGLTQELVSGSWAAALGLTTTNRKRLFLFALALGAGYLLLRWYQSNYGGSIFGLFGGLF